jgi:hypothetical protein
MKSVLAGLRITVVLASALSPAAAGAGQTVAVFPFDMAFQKSEEDFYLGASGPNKDEQRRLDIAREALIGYVKADGRYTVADLSPVAADITAAAPIYQCNGCEVDLAGKIKADLVMTSLIDKISETHLSLNVALVDVANNKLLSNSSVLIQGNTDEAWLHGVKWLAKNRLFKDGAKQDEKIESGKSGSAQ